jgi:lysophospholipase L1-like esterase
MRDLNELIRASCAKTGIRLADLFPQFADAEGNLRSEYSDDGAHLTAQGYGLVARIIYEAVKPILGEGAPDP